LKIADVDGFKVGIEDEHRVFHTNEKL
jgi:hypothetical protein